MSEVKKVNTIIGFGEPIVDHDLKSYENDAYFIEKEKKAMDRLSRVKFPDHMLKKQESK